ncbi:hypothetical protein Fmac_025546 [Flemingia macrophylla]|uniref:Uncharacterized protein n=1 Tax=Flemingia macrophylla TaxID=520843 RepID=A0ABD1LSI3_9FABA
MELGKRKETSMNFKKRNLIVDDFSASPPGYVIYLVSKHLLGVLLFQVSELKM